MSAPAAAATAVAKTGTWWKYAAAIGIPAAAFGAYALGTHTAPPSTAVQNQPGPGGVVFVDTQGTQTQSGGGDLFGGLMDMVPMFLLVMMLPSLLKGFKSNGDE